VEDKKTESVVPKKSATRAAPVYKDPYIEQEEMDLARLSKLLGIDKGSNRWCFLVRDYFITINTLIDLAGSKKKAASKLNKEFDLYEVSLLVDCVRFTLRELNFSNNRYD